MPLYSFTPFHAHGSGRPVVADLPNDLWALRHAGEVLAREQGASVTVREGTRHVAHIAGSPLAESPRDVWCCVERSRLLIAQSLEVLRRSHEGTLRGRGSSQPASDDRP